MNKLLQLLKDNFPDKTVGETYNMLITSWLDYLEWHMAEHECDMIKLIGRIRANQILEIIGEKPIEDVNKLMQEYTLLTNSKEVEGKDGRNK